MEANTGKEIGEEMEAGGRMEEKAQRDSPTSHVCVRHTPLHKGARLVINHGTVALLVGLGLGVPGEA